MLVSLDGSLNLFSYCNNNPIINSDPSGHFFAEIGVAIGAALVAAAAAVTAVVIVASKAVSDAIKNSSIGTKLEDAKEKLRDKVAEIDKKHVHNNYVYTLVNPSTNVVEYVGRTKDIARRTNEHKSDPKTSDLQLGSYIGGLTYSQARVIEQESMVAYHTLKAISPNGRNSINGISPSNPNLFAYYQAFEDFVYNELSNEYYNFIEIMPGD